MIVEMNDMGRYNLQHIDRGVIYLPIHNNMSDTEIDDMIKEHQCQGQTIVLFRSGKYDMKNILKELLKTRLDT
jgi:hypothetical protein